MQTPDPATPSIAPPGTLQFIGNATVSLRWGDLHRVTVLPCGGAMALRPRSAAAVS